jgi:hypothetical protein
MRTRARLVIAVGMLALLLQGCDKFPYLFHGRFPAVPAGVDAEATAVLYALPTPFPAGTLQISGQLAPQTLAPLPPTLRFSIRRFQGAAVVDSLTFDVSVQPDGTILNQVVVTPAATLQPGEELRFFVQPVGANLPLGRMKLKLLYEKA